MAKAIAPASLKFIFSNPFVDVRMDGKSRIKRNRMRFSIRRQAQADQADATRVPALGRPLG
jgi:hypothetical protein